MSSFGVGSGLGWRAGVQSGILPSFFFFGGGGGGGSLSLVLIVFAWLFQLFFLLSRLLKFLGFLLGFLSSRFQCLLIARGGWNIVLGYPPSVAWLREGLPCFFLSVTFWLALVGLRCFWVLRSCGVQGLRDGVTCPRSGLCSSSVRDRNEDFPSFWWVWFLAFVWKSPISGRGCVLRPALVPDAIPPYGGFGSVPSRWVNPSQGLVCVGTSHICSERGLCLRFSCVFLRDVATHWVQCVFSSLLITIVGFLW